MTNYQLSSLIVAGIVPSLILAWLGVHFMRWFAPRIGLIDQPGTRKVHLVPKPLGGGVGIWFGVIGTFAVATAAILLTQHGDLPQGWSPDWIQPHLPGLTSQLPRLWFLLGCGSTLAGLGLMDDKKGLRWQTRLLVEFAVAAAAVTWGQAKLSAFLKIPYLEWFLSVLWIVGLINSFNMLDNMDGLSGGIAAISSALLTTVLLLNPDPVTQRPQIFVCGLLLVLTGALLGFLWHNRPPAKIFMGDSGSYFIGFMIAVSTLLSTYANYTSNAHAVLTPLCVMAVPLYDMVTVLWIRVRERRSLFQGDKSHFSHRLVDLGLSKPQAVLTIYLTTATCGLGALLLHRVDLTGAAIIGCLISCVFLLIRILESSALRKLKS